MKSFAVVRADDSDKVKIALHDLEQYGRMRFSCQPKRIEPNYADHLLTSVMGVSLKSSPRHDAYGELMDNSELYPDFDRTFENLEKITISEVE